MYTKVSNKSYRDVPFADLQDNRYPNYVYSSVTDLSKKRILDDTQAELVSCRTVGILQSIHGKFYVCDINATGGEDSDIKIHISVVYMKSPQATAMLESLVLPCPVQIFGAMRWLGKKQVIFTKILQVLTIPKALQIKDVMDQLLVLKSQTNR